MYEGLIKGLYKGGTGMDALVTVFSWSTNGITCHRILLEYERNYGLGMDALVTRILLEHERNYGLGMDAPVPVFS